MKKRISENFRILLDRKAPWGRILANFFSLGLLKATDALVLILLIPLITARVGIGHFGMLAFATVFLNAGKTILDYGFHISGVRRIALARENRVELSGIFSDILFTRIFLFLVFAAFLVVVVQLIPFLKTRETVFYWGLILPLGHIVFADWFFIGVQEVRLITWANLVMKLLYAGLVAGLVCEPADYVFIPALQGLAGLLVGAAVIYRAGKRFGVRLAKPGWKPVQNFLRTDFRLCFSNLATEFNTSFSILLLGLLTTDSLTGYFNVMQKLAQPLRFLLVIFSQAIFPVMCKKTLESRQSVLQFLRTVYLYFFPIPLAATLVIALAGDFLLEFFAGYSDEYLLFNFRIYLLAPVIILLNIPATQVLLAYERQSDYTAVYLAAMLLKTVLDYALIRSAGLYGLMISTLVVEGVILAGLYGMVWWRRRLF